MKLLLCMCDIDGQRSTWKDPSSCLHMLEVWRKTRNVGELFLLLRLSSWSPSFLLSNIVRTTLLHWKVLLNKSSIFIFILSSQVSSHLWCWSALLIANYVVGINVCVRNYSKVILYNIDILIHPHVLYVRGLFLQVLSLAHPNVFPHLLLMIFSTFR